jgi:putative ABC transport system permease protein
VSADRTRTRKVLLRRDIPLPLLLMWRRIRSPEGRLAPLAALSIAVSVALATALEMSSRSAQLQLEKTAEAMAGAAKVEITAGKVGFAESVLELVRGEKEVLAASPLLSTRLRLVDRAFPMNVIGADFLAEDQIRPMTVTRRGMKIRDPLRLIASPKAILVTQELLDRLGAAEAWRKGEDVEIPVRTAKGTRTVVVQGVLEPGGLATAFGGQVALMDVYALQALVGREGWFDRIDVVPAPGTVVPQLVASLGDKLRGVASVRESSTRTREIDQAIDIVRVAALVIAAAGALAACLLAYASTAQLVDRQRKQLATLRAVGMEARRVQQEILREIGVLALIGTLVGLVAGVALAPTMLTTLSSFAATMGAEKFTAVSVQPSTVAIALVVGILAAFAGGVIPARRAGRRYTLDALESESSTVRDSRRWQIGLALALSATAAAWMTSPSAFAGAALVRILVIFIAGLGAIFSAAPLLLQLIDCLLRPVRHVIPALGHLVGRSYAARPWSFAVAVAAISSLIAALTAVFLLVETVNVAVERWTSPGSRRGVQILPESLADLARFEVLSPDTIRVIRETPGVEAVDERYMGMATILFRDTEVALLARSMPVAAEYGHISSVGKPSSELARELADGGVALSMGFAKRFGIHNQSDVVLDTSQGPVSFPIKGFFEDFGGSGGSILLDLKTFDSHWKRSGASSAIVWTGSAHGDVLEAIRQNVGESQYLFFADLTAIENYNRRVIGVFSGVLRGIAGFVASLGGFAVAILLLGIVAERRHDFALLRAAGSSPWQLTFLVLADATVVGTSASVAGLVLGLTCAMPTTDVLRETYGWILEQSWSAPELPLLAAGATIAAVLASVVPAAMAYRTVSADIFAPE